ncbi:MAG TPA: hypothetical protein VJ735_01880 [Actinomycetes bacterium]|nr:hypothetical protein [Actinomycetes bacterium]
MAAQAPDGTTGRVAGAAGIALVLVGLTLLLEPASWRPVAAVVLAAGLVVGALVAMRRPPSARLRTPMERLNDAAFLVVVAIVALIAVRLARPWSAALPGLVGGALLGLTLRPRPTHPNHSPDPDRTSPERNYSPDPGSASPDPGSAGPEPGRAGTPGPGTEPPGGGA